MEKNNLFYGMIKSNNAKSSVIALALVRNFSSMLITGKKEKKKKEQTNCRKTKEGSIDYAYIHRPN